MSSRCTAAKTGVQVTAKALAADAIWFAPIVQSQYARPTLATIHGENSTAVLVQPSATDIKRSSAHAHLVTFSNAMLPKVIPLQGLTAPDRVHFREQTDVGDVVVAWQGERLYRFINGGVESIPAPHCREGTVPAIMSDGTILINSYPHHDTYLYESVKVWRLGGVLQQMEYSGIPRKPLPRIVGRVSEGKYALTIPTESPSTLFVVGSSGIRETRELPTDFKIGNSFNNYYSLSSFGEFSTFGASCLTKPIAIADKAGSFTYSNLRQVRIGNLFRSQGGTYFADATFHEGRFASRTLYRGNSVNSFRAWHPSGGSSICRDAVSFGQGSILARFAKMIDSQGRWYFASSPDSEFVPVAGTLNNDNPISIHGALLDNSLVFGTEYRNTAAARPLFRIDDSNHAAPKFELLAESAPTPCNYSPGVMCWTRRSEKSQAGNRIGYVCLSKSGISRLDMPERDILSITGEQGAASFVVVTFNRKTNDVEAAKFDRDLLPAPF